MTCKRCSHWLPQPLSCASSSSSELMLEYSWKSFQTVHFPTAPTLGEHIPKRWKKTQSHSCPMANDLYSEKLSWNLKHIFVYDDFILIIYMISTWNLLFFGYSIFQFSFLLVFRGHSPPPGSESLSESLDSRPWRPAGRSKWLKAYQNKAHHIDHLYSSWWLNQPIWKIWVKMGI